MAGIEEENTMLTEFIAGFFIGAAAVTWWALSEGKKEKDMIEILDIKDTEPKEEKPLDITQELAKAAYNTLRQYCRNQAGCRFGCPFHREICENAFYEEPDVWPELEVPNE